MSHGVFTKSHNRHVRGLLRRLTSDRNGSGTGVAERLRHPGVDRGGVRDSRATNPRRGDRAVRWRSAGRRPGPRLLANAPASTAWRSAGACEKGPTRVAPIGFLTPAQDDKERVRGLSPRRRRLRLNRSHGDLLLRIRAVLRLSTPVDSAYRRSGFACAIIIASGRLRRDSPPRVDWRTVSGSRSILDTAMMRSRRGRTDLRTPVGVRARTSAMMRRPRNGATLPHRLTFVHAAARTHVIRRWRPSIASRPQPGASGRHSGSSVYPKSATFRLDARHVNAASRT